MSRRADITLTQFRSQADNYGSELQIAWDESSFVRESFQNEEEIGLDLCDLLKTSILALRKPIQSFCRLLDPHSDMPEAAIPFRYSLIMALHRIDYLVNELQMLITLYRNICQTPSRTMLLRRQEINRKLDELTKIIGDVPKLIDVLLFQAHYHELAG